MLLSNHLIHQILSHTSTDATSYAPMISPPRQSEEKPSPRRLFFRRMWPIVGHARVFPRQDICRDIFRKFASSGEERGRGGQI